MIVNGPVPENTPDIVAEPDVGEVMVPPAVLIVKFVLEEFPDVRTSVPPLKTGLAVTPIFERVKLEPAVNPALGLGTGEDAGAGVGVGVGDGAGAGAGAGVVDTTRSQMLPEEFTNCHEKLPYVPDRLALLIFKLLSPLKTAA